MIEYKKEVPKFTFHNSIEHQLASIIKFSEEILLAHPSNSEIQKKAFYIIEEARKAWDFVPDESAPRIDGGTKNEK